MIERQGDRLALRGAITFADVTEWREAGLRELDRDGLVIDLGGVTEADSSSLSLLLEWQRAAKARGFKLAFANLPDGMRSLAEVYDVVELIPLAPK